MPSVQLAIKIESGVPKVAKTKCRISVNKDPSTFLGTNSSCAWAERFVTTTQQANTAIISALYKAY